MRPAKKISPIALCLILLSVFFTQAWAADSPGYSIAIPSQFDGQGYDFNKGLAVVENGGKYGIIDQTGGVIVDFVYDYLYNNAPFTAQVTPGDYYIAIQAGKWGIIDKSGRLLVPCRYDSILEASQGLAIVGLGKPRPPGGGVINGLWGLVDVNSAREITPIQYSNISPVKDSSFLIAAMNNKWGVIDRTGKEIIPLKYDYIVPAGQSFVVTLGSKTGLLGKNNRFMVPLGVYEIISDFQGEYAVVQKQYKLGLLNSTGKLVVPAEYKTITVFRGLVLAAKGDKYGVLDVAGRVVIPFEYDTGGFTGNGAIVMQQQSKKVVFDGSGKVIAPLGKFDDAYIGAGQTDNLIFVKRQGKVGAIDTTGKQILPLIYKDTGEVQRKNGLAVVATDDKTLVVNQNGQILLSLDKNWRVVLGDDGNIQAISAVNWKRGLFNRNGKAVLPCEFSWINPMSENYLVANNEKGYAVFNKDGQIIVPFGEFTYIGFSVSENMVDFRNNGLTGYIRLPAYVEQPDTWAKPEVDRAVAAGLVPEDMRKNYRDNITRAEFCRLAVNLIEVKTGMKIDIFMNTRGMSGRLSSPVFFIDTADQNVLAASRLGIVYGVGNNKFNPSGQITRQDAAVLLQRTAKVLDITEPTGTPLTFSDSNKFSNYAFDAIGFVSAATDKESGNPVMGSTGSNNFSPQNQYTREQAYITVLRLFNAMK